MPSDITIALIGAAVLILGAAGVYIGGRITNKAAEEKAERIVEERAAVLKSEIEALNVEDRKALRRYFEERIAELNLELRACQKANEVLQRRIDRLEGKDTS